LKPKEKLAEVVTSFVYSFNEDMFFYFQIQVFSFTGKKSTVNLAKVYLDIQLLKPHFPFFVLST
jgi:hypothetical protein